MTQEFTIERLTEFNEKEAKEIRSLAKKIGHNHKELTDEDYKLMLTSPSNFLYVAKEVASGKIAGMISLVVVRIPYVKKSSFEDLVVDENYRGKGIGTMLLKKAIEKAKEENAAYIDFTSRPRRVEGNELYKRLGFAQRETNVYRLILNYNEV